MHDDDFELDSAYPEPPVWFAQAFPVEVEAEVDTIPKFRLGII